jgi:short-subunit dehydrogenase
VLAARRTARLDALSQELGGALAVTADVTDRAAVARIVEQALDRHGRIDGLVNSTGVSLHRRIDELGLDEFTRVLDLNVVSVVAMTQAVLNMLTAVARKELEADGIAVSLVVPSITATEFAGGRFQAGQIPRPGMIAHSPEYVGGFILRALRTGQESIDIPHGPEQPGLTAVPPS